MNSKRSLLDRLPILGPLRMSTGLQRGMLVAGLVLSILFVLTALLAPVLAPYGFAQLAADGHNFGAQQPPSAAHLMGTTTGGYDVLSRTLWGAQTALIVIVLGVVCSIVVGVALGLVSGYVGGWIDRVLVVVCDAIYAFPALLLAIVVSIVISGGQSSLWGGIMSAAISITVVFVPQYFRVVRAETVRLKAEPFIEASRVLGTASVRILATHVFRNATRTLPLIFTLNASESILTLAGLGFLGFGIEPSSAAEWGYDLNKALSDTTSGIWWTGLAPGIAVVLTVLGITLVGESLNDLNDPRLRSRRRAKRARRGTATAVAGEAGRVLEIEDLRVDFATDAGTVPAVDGVSLTVAPGEVLAVVGESGSGKSVTARSILGLLPETATASGAVLVGGDDVVEMGPKELRRLRGGDVAMVFQEPSTALNPVYPIGWQIAEGIRAHTRLGRRAVRERTIEVLRQVGIPEPEKRVDYYPHQLSGGQKQRVVIACALALDPQLIVADEPTTALDVTVQAEILALLRELRESTGCAIVLITHNMGVVADLADRVAVMYRGALVEEAPVGELFAAPREEYTRRLLGSVPRLEAGHGDVAADGETDAGEAPSAGRPGPAGSPVVEARGLEVTFAGRLGRGGFRAVRGVDFTIGAGEVLGLVGESGSGKTTIGRTVAGLTRATGGSLGVFGGEMVGFRERDFRPSRRDIGFVFQDPAASFDPHLTIEEAVAEPLRVHGDGAGDGEVRRRVAEMLEAVQLPASYASRFPHELSGGQRQRASLARALVLRPRLVVADEPTSALDVTVQAHVLEIFREMQAELGFACLFISHDLAVVGELAHRVGVLYRGELVEQGPVGEVLHAPRHEYTRRLLASLPVPDPAEQAERRRLLAGA